MEPVLSPAAPRDAPGAAVRGAPGPLRGGPLALLRFLFGHGMLSPKYLRSYARLAWVKLRFRGRVTSDGIAFVGPGISWEIGPQARVHLGRWSWLGHGCKVRVHEGRLDIGAKSVLGQECTISAFQRISIGRECIIADRVMLIDFDHGASEHERAIRDQGIYKRDVHIGHNAWVGYGACFLRGVTVGDNVIVGALTVVTKDVPDNAVVGGVPARVLRMRPTPQRLRWR